MTTLSKFMKVFEWIGTDNYGNDIPQKNYYVVVTMGSMGYMNCKLTGNYTEVVRVNN